MNYIRYEKLLSPDEAVEIAKKSLNVGHMELSTKIMDEWYRYRSTQDDWKANENFEVYLMLSCVFYAGMILGARLLRYRKKQKKALRR